MIEHSKSVRMGVKKSLMVVDMPHNTYRNSTQALRNAKVIISKTGNVLGNIDAPRVTLEDGAKFKGSIAMDPDEQPTVKAVRSGKSDLFPASAVAADNSKAS